jgi:anhydro-N-acetylmuramic acid kinase
MIENKQDRSEGRPIYILGIMSGTSLDGVDLALCRFHSVTRFHIVKAITVKYPHELQKKLALCMNLSAEKLAMLNHELGIFYGKISLAFLKRNKLNAHYISSHGHTVFHNPDRRYTLQIGNGACLAAASRIPVISDFRSADIALGGQGAPLVPMGDELWFSNFGSCINLGGIANVSFKKNEHRIAFDICVCNIALNELAEKKGKPFDKNGILASKGKMLANVFNTLNSLAYFSKKHPKSLGKEWYEKSMKPVLNGNTLDLLRTVTEHVAFHIFQSVKNVPGKILLTGGGAHNRFLVERIKNYCRQEVVIPDTTFINFKEAAIFALLGYLRVLEMPNVLASVTGAQHDHCSGTLHLP